MEEAIEAEKARTAELQEQVKQLQAQMQLAQAKAQPTPVAVATEPPEKSRLENLVEQALSRMAVLEENMTAAAAKQAETVQEKKSVSDTVKYKRSEKVLPEQTQDGEEQSEDDDDDEEEEEDTEETITTPSGQTVPLMIYMHAITIHLLYCSMVQKFMHQVCSLPLIWSFAYIDSYLSQVNISGDALRMRCRRLCERKPSGKYNISEQVCQQYKEGGPSRELLEMALLECVSKHGLNRSAYKKVKARLGLYDYIYKKPLKLAPL